MYSRKRARSQNASASIKKTKHYKGVVDSNLSYSQGIRRSLQRLKIKNTDIEATIKHSHLFIELTRDQFEICQKYMGQLFEVISDKKLKLNQSEEFSIFYLRLINFNPLDYCLLLSFVFENLAKMWIYSKDVEDPWSISKDVPIRGSFYVYKNCEFVATEDTKRKQQRKKLSRFEITQSKFNILNGFQEIFVKNDDSTIFIDELAGSLNSLHFRGIPQQTEAIFFNSLKDKNCALKINICEFPLITKGLISSEDDLKFNYPIIEKSKKELGAYAKKLLEYNEQKKSGQPESKTEVHQQSETTQKQKAQSKQAHSYSQQRSQKTNSGELRYNGNRTQQDERYSSSNTHYNDKKPGFMTQEQIKEYCFATIRASMDTVNSKSPYQILKTYVKCPRQYYIDLVYQNLNELRSRTNCNIVVLNLNNLHEASAWFDSLNVAPYTKLSNVPHPSTVRVVSIGGVGEHNLKALQLVWKLMEQGCL